MKKFIIAIVSVFLITLATVNVYMGDNGDRASSIVSLLNIEAIASGEDGGGQASCTCTKDCGNGTTASCTGYQWCRCNILGLYMECDGVRAEC